MQISWLMLENNENKELAYNKSYDQITYETTLTKVEVHFKYLSRLFTE